MIRIDFHSHYGNEYYCPVSLLRVYGLTHLEQYKREEWETEYEKRRGEADLVIAQAQVPLAAEVVQDTAEDTNEAPIATAADASETPVGSSENSPETADMSASSTTAASIQPSELPLTETSLPTSANIVHAEKPLKEESKATTVSDSVPSEKILPASQTTVPEASPTSSGIQGTSDDSIKASPSPENQASSSQESSYTNQPYSLPSRSSVIPTIVPHESKAVPALASSGESIFRTIMTRLTALETNSTLILRYVEEQTRGLRDALRRLEEDVGRLEGLVSIF